MLTRRLLLALLFAAFSFTTSLAAEKKQVLLIGQAPDGHAKNTHEYRAGVRILAQLLKDHPQIETTVTSGDGAWAEGPKMIDKADAVVIFVSQGARWIAQDKQRLEAFRRLAARGGGILALHWGMGAKDAKYINTFLKLVGGIHGGPDRKYKYLETDLVVAAKDHPITRGVEDIRLKEEFYYRLKLNANEGTLIPLLRAKIDGQWETVCFAWEREDGGRSFAFSGLHYHKNWEQLLYRRLMSQAVLWTLKLPVPEGGIDASIPKKQLKVQPGERS